MEHAGKCDVRGKGPDGFRPTRPLQGRSLGPRPIRGRGVSTHWASTCGPVVSAEWPNSMMSLESKSK